MKGRRGGQKLYGGKADGGGGRRGGGGVGCEAWVGAEGGVFG